MEHAGTRVQELMDKLEKTSVWEPPTVLCIALDHLTGAEFLHLVGIVTDSDSGKERVWHVVGLTASAFVHIVAETENLNRISAGSKATLRRRSDVTSIEVTDVKIADSDLLADVTWQINFRDGEPVHLSTHGRKNAVRKGLTALINELRDAEF